MSANIDVRKLGNRFIGYVSPLVFAFGDTEAEARERAAAKAEGFYRSITGSNLADKYMTGGIDRALVNLGNSAEVSAVVALANIRAAVGDTEGQLTPGELVERCRDLCTEVQRLHEGVEECLRENAHLADGDDCTLRALKALL